MTEINTLADRIDPVAAARPEAEEAVREPVGQA
jgi:hypothetical protein